MVTTATRTTTTTRTPSEDEHDPARPDLDCTHVMIETPRLLMREMAWGDLPALRSILGDTETMVAYEGAFDDDMTRAWMERMLERYRDDGFGLWAVVLRDPPEGSDGMIGQCGLTRQHILGSDVVEVGYLFNRSFWHRGYATEAATACRDHAFNTLRIDRLYAQIRDTNIASMNVAIRLGMTVRGRFIKHYRGVDMPHLAFAVDRQVDQIHHEAPTDRSGRQPRLA